MVNQSTISAQVGARKTSKRVGRGNSSGKGTFCTRGCKGQKSRSGKKIHPLFEGGQTPFFMRTPKRKGFTALNKIIYSVINLDDLEALATSGKTEINAKVLKEVGLIKKEDTKIKLLAFGDLTQKISLQVNAASKNAKEVIKKQWGKLIIG